MISKHIQGANTRAGGPGCYDLMVRREEYAPGTFMYSSAWEPTPDEVRLLLAGGSFVVTILGGQPPMLVSVTPPVPDHPSYPTSTPDNVA